MHMMHVRALWSAWLRGLPSSEEAALLDVAFLSPLLLPLDACPTSPVFFFIFLFRCQSQSSSGVHSGKKRRKQGRNLCNFWIKNGAVNVFFSGSPRELRRRKKKRFHQPSPGLHFPVISACCLAAFSRSSIVSSLQMMTMALRISSWPSREVMVREQKEKRGEVKSESFLCGESFFFFFFLSLFKVEVEVEEGGEDKKKAEKGRTSPPRLSTRGTAEALEVPARQWTLRKRE